MPARSRRSLLQAAVGGVAGLSLGLLPGARSFLAHAQPAGGSPADLGGKFHVLDAGGTNVLAVATGEGLALVDGAPAVRASGLAEQLAALPGQGRVHTLFNTHWHPEQTGSNETFAAAGATIVAHENTRLWLATDVTWPWSGETVEPLPDAALPSNTFYDRIEVDIGGERAQCGYLRDCPHTDGDIYVFFPGSNVLAVGDAVSGAGWPSIDWWTGGWIGGIVGGLDILLTVANEATRVVPARGPVLGYAELLSQYRMYSVIWERLAQLLYEQGAGPEDAIAARPTAEFDAKMGPSEAFVRRAFESLWAYLSPDA